MRIESSAALSDGHVGSPSLYQLIAEGLCNHGYAILEGALPVEVRACLAQDIAHRNRQEFHQAGVGRGTLHTQTKHIRRDKIAWIDGFDDNFAPWKNWTGGLQQYLNRQLYLGLFSFESHFAVYQPGDYYRMHVDAFRGESNRVVSLVTYLNDTWDADWGGQLRIFDTDCSQVLADILPLMGTIVAFLSEEFPHEVLAATQVRYSVAGWFRLNGSVEGRIDPPR